LQKKTIIRQREIGHSIAAFSTAGHEADELRYTLFIEQPDISNSPYDYRVEYALSTMIWNTEKDRTLICIHINKENDISGIDFEVFYDAKMPEDLKKSSF